MSMNKSRMIYLDYNATTPLCDAAREATQPYLDRYFGNPSSVHAAGRVDTRWISEIAIEIWLRRFARCVAQRCRCIVIEINHSALIHAHARWLRNASGTLAL